MTIVPVVELVSGRLKVKPIGVILHFRVKMLVLYTPTIGIVTHSTTVGVKSFVGADLGAVFINFCSTTRQLGTIPSIVTLYTTLPTLTTGRRPRRIAYKGRKGKPAPYTLSASKRVSGLPRAVSGHFRELPAKTPRTAYSGFDGCRGRRLRRPRGSGCIDCRGPRGCSGKGAEDTLDPYKR